MSRDISDINFIIFGAGNYNSLGVLHCMAKSGVKAFILNVGSGRDRSKGEIILYSKWATDYHCVHSESDGLEWLVNNADLFPVGTVIYPTSDMAEKVLDENSDVLAGRFKFPMTGQCGNVALLMEKHRQMELASAAGVRVLDSQYTNDPSFSFEKVIYPCMVKPLDSTRGSKGDMKVCEDEDQLRDALSSGKHTKDFIVQQYIRNEADLLFLGVADMNSEVWMPAVVVKPGVSPTGEYTHAIVSTDVKKYLDQYDCVVKFIRDLKYSGPFSIEFGLEKGKTYFFEINLRNDGTSHYPLAAGINIPMAYYEAMRGKRLPDAVSGHVEYDMIDEVGDLRRVQLGEIGLFQWVKALKNAGTYRYYQQGDYRLIRPLSMMFLSRTFGKIGRMLRM